jgi:hypothetical protein
VIRRSASAPRRRSRRRLRAVRRARLATATCSPSETGRFAVAAALGPLALARVARCDVAAAAAALEAT